MRLYARECIADAATSYFLTLTGIYKPARLSLRSGIENALRVSIASAGADITEFVTIPDLVVEAKSNAKTIEQRSRIEGLYSDYGDLSHTVHSVSIKYMSLRVPFEKIAKYEKEEAKRNLAIILRVIRGINELMFVDFHNRLGLIDFRNADLVKDAIEAKVKSEALKISI